MGDIIGVAVQEAIAGGKPPKDALDQAASQTRDYLKKTRLYGTPRSYTEP
jgi:ABC-type glycerol-3-phosphate transport system substrate-binding protein